MCCFSGPVSHVSNTKIFARPLEGGRQALAYSMRFGAAADVAMVLPLPVPPRPADDALRFISLEGYDDFFDDVKSAFPRPQTLSFGIPPPAAAPATAKMLVVHEVGDFDASFVPTRADFDRLDPRFDLAPEVWDALPRYADWGFAVFELRGGAQERKDVHPMAFDFPRRDPSSLFFPTVHVHDGAVHEEASFDHHLYCQLAADVSEVASWESSAGPLGGYVDVERAAGLVDGDAYCFRRQLVGVLPNRDQTLALA